MKEPYNNLDSPFTNLIDILFSLTITPLVILSSLVIGLRDKIFILPFVFGIFCLLIMWVTFLPLPWATGAAYVLTGVFIYCHRDYLSDKVKPNR
ncbi:MAG: hypothetical protein A3G02_00480 [Candidatus Yanofskybacteria bacterium RIFCSPLOWO2_12_FULL_44_13b]|uniref:Uncharacterized protein n=2 Tax=Candidatus Yanofskyibacteriota TaxID=1752733 RepID=A0A1F8GZI6_9BACT|nr:MAG: hypothetical protein UW14_C0004G0013 [Candidatus Yanofskybacteria bacterium GW2011_GWA2_44_10]KKT90315.1 MAG: hypothetical protein UW90_C0003G0039 [Candidatus Yanofskybacteria bacterium GW2011_GWB1_45_11]OGN03651.1 MAG: hypothetical protein A2657_01645 [Candidatus Yanofskybacteria bacterium RIFCSPHIGHO2_01_FULL_44_110b]OGN14529.1 MAG: hypothetical protein A3C01_00375 [Candidatus Yanofskybacteria bacterium RIFCSPHIGHO2_02_FULL_44_36b]OGN18202.1 MAG: hypothetical protein A3F50_02430 [Cand